MKKYCRGGILSRKAGLLPGLILFLLLTPGVILAADPQVETVTSPEEHSVEAAAESIPENFQLEDELREEVVDTALRFIDTRYVYGGMSYETGLDCSSFVQLVFADFDIDLPRVASAQSSSGRRIDRKDLRKGDLVFFRIRGRRIDHVGIFIGDGLFLHANRTGGEVRTGKLNDAFWRQKYAGARRVLPD